MCKSKFIKACLVIVSMVLASVASGYAQDSDRFKLADPQSVSGEGGWSVDASNGRMSFGLPVSAVPGEIPIPLSYRWEGSALVEITNFDVDLYRSCNGSYCFLSRAHQHSGSYRGPSGSIHFGYSLGATSPVSTASAFCVLEDGRVLQDWKRGVNIPGGVFNLPPKFGFPTVAPGSMLISTDAAYAIYETTVGSLGSAPDGTSWDSRIPAPVGFPAIQRYRVVMDQNIARVFVRVDAMAPPNGTETPTALWAPALWVDRFGHWVSFKWEMLSNPPVGVSNIFAVTALNNHSKGIQAQWAIPNAGVTLDLMFRADFIGIESPSIVMQATPWASMAVPSIFQAIPDDTHWDVSSCPAMAGVVLIPTMIQVGHPNDIPRPSWLSAGKSLPAPAGNASSAPILIWQFTYDPGSSDLTSIQSPIGVRSDFSYQILRMYSAPKAPYDRSPLERNIVSNTVTQVNSVVSVSSVDTQTGTTRTKSWSRSLPVSDGTAWVQSNWMVTLQDAFSGSDIIAKGGRVIQFQFAGGASGRDYLNATLMKRSLLPTVGSTSPLAEISMTYDSSGLDGGLSAMTGYTSSSQGKPDTSVVFAWQDTWRLQAVGRDMKVGNIVAESTTRTVESHWDLLEPARALQSVTYRFDSAGAALAPASITTKSEYDSNGFLKKVYATDGVSKSMGTNYEYDNDGRLSVSTNFASDAVGGITRRSLSFGSDGYIQSAATQITQDGTSNLVSVFQASQTSYLNGLPQVSTDELGVATNTTWDVRGRMTSRQRDGFPVVTFGYPSERTRTITQNGQTQKETMDGFGRITKIEYPNGMVELRAYDQSGRLARLSQATAKGTRVSQVSYDLLDRVVSETGFSGQVVTTRYSSAGPLSQVTRTNASTGAKRVIQTDGLGNVVKLEKPNGARVLTSYNALGKVLQSVTQERDANGNVKSTQTRSFAYDSLGRLTSKTEPETNLTQYGQFNALGLPQSITEGVGSSDQRARTVAFDGLGRVRSVVTAAGERVDYSYSGALLTSVSSQYFSGAQKRTISQAYTYGGPGGALSQENIVFPEGSTSTTQYSFDSLGRMASVTYPGGRLVSYGYDSLSRVVSVSSGTTLLASVAYDEWGAKKQLLFSSGAKSEWITDAAGMHLQSWQIGFNGGNEARTYEYDAADNLTKAGEWTLLHDSIGQLTKAAGSGITAAYLHDQYGNNISHLATGTVPSSYNNFTFNTLADNQIPATANNGAMTGWIRNGEGEAISVGVAVGYVASLGITRDSYGRVHGVAGNGQSQLYSYAPSGLRVENIDLVSIAASRRYIYGAANLPLAEYALVYGQSVAKASLGSTSASGTMALSTNALAKPMAVIPPGGCYTDVYMMQPPSDLLTTVNTPFSFAARADTINGSTSTGAFRWDFGDGTTASGSPVTHSFTKTGVFTVSVSRAYGGCVKGSDVRRVTVSVPPPIISSYTGNPGASAYPGQVCTLAWVVSNATKVMVNGQVVSGSSLMVTPAETTTFTLTASNAGGSVSVPLTIKVADPQMTWLRDVIYLGGTAIAEIDASGIHELHCDHLGTPRVITKQASSQVEGRQAYGPYGEYLANQSTGYKPLTGFTGHMQTDSTGLIYMRGRFYSPAWHRFLDSDKGVDPNSVNQVAYVCGSPMMNTDPSGFRELPQKKMDPGFVFSWMADDASGDNGGWSNPVDFRNPEGGILSVEEPAWLTGFTLGEWRIPSVGILKPDGIEWHDEVPWFYPADPDRSGVFVQNRWLSALGTGPLPTWAYASHRFVFTTTRDGGVLHTYSWGNDGEPGSWGMDRPEDIDAAQAALWSGGGLNQIGGADLVQSVDLAYYALSGVSNQEHINYLIANNCWAETSRLIILAREFNKMR